MINLESYLQPRRRLPFGLAMTTLVLLAGSAWLAVHAWHRYDVIVGQKKANQDMQAAIAKTKQAPKPTRSELDKAKHWQELQEERDFPWFLVFQTIERANSKDIELLEFQPDKHNRRIVLRGEAKDSTALTSYLALLAAQPGMSQVHLLHQQNVLHDKLETVSFEIKASIPM
jgi:hypothetical protein